MEWFLRFIRGYVKIQVRGSQLERFLNLCRSRGIIIRELKNTGDNKLTGYICKRDFFLFGPVRAKTGVRIHILEKHGLPFFFHRNRKRKAFFLGILCCFILMIFLTSRIWNIHIQGNVTNTTPEILKFLENEGICHGIAKNSINCSRLAASVRQNYPEITWVSAKIQGTRLILTIQEGIIREQTVAEDGPCDLSAGVSGRIVKMVTRQGVPLMKKGDLCQEGDILVRGRLDITNDSKEVVRYEYVHADADVYVEHDIAYYDEFSMLYKKEVPEGTEKTVPFLKVGSWYFRLGSKCPENWRQTVTETPVRITENFVLPISFGKMKYEKYTQDSGRYTKEEAAAIARARLDDYMEILMEKGVQISVNSVKIDTDYSACISSGTLTVIERTGEESPAEILAQPTERTTENGE